MPAFSGRAGTPLRATPDPLVLECRWSHVRAMAGARVTLRVRLGHAGDGTPVRFSVLDGEGTEIATFRERAESGVAAREWILPPESAGRLAFLVQVPDLDLSARSGPLEVVARRPIGPVQARDPQGARLQVVELDRDMTWACPMPGIEDGTEVAWSVWCRLDAHRSERAASGFAEVRAGACAVPWKPRLPLDDGALPTFPVLDRRAENWANATFVAAFECLASTAIGDALPIRTGIAFRSNVEAARPCTFPDGSDADVDPDVERRNLAPGSVERLPAASADNGNRP